VAYSQRLIDAFTYAADLHADQTRKGTGVPYITHLMAVGALVGEHGGSEDQVIAALLHDAVEDQGGKRTLDAIRTRFGEPVAEYIAACSDTDVHPKPPWRERKEAFVVRTRTACPEAKLIIAADKLHNMRSLTVIIRREGHAVWERFRGGREGTAWYHRAMLEALGTAWRHPILDELDDALAVLHRAESDAAQA